MDAARAEELLTGIQGLEFANDLDTLLANRQAQLWLSWKGKWASLYLATPAGVEPLLRISKDKRVHRYEYGEVGDRFHALLQAHRAVMQMVWKTPKLVIAQAHFPDLGHTYAARLIETPRDTRSRYMTATDETTLQAAGQWPPRPERLR